MKKLSLLALVLVFTVGCQIQKDKVQTDKNQTKVMVDINKTKHKRVLTKENLKEAGREIKEATIETAKKLKTETVETAKVVKSSVTKLYKEYFNKDKNKTTKPQQK